MFSGKTLFSQFIELIHPQQFRRCVARYRGNYKVKAFSCWYQFLCMAITQLIFRESLRDIEDCMYSGLDRGVRLRVGGDLEEGTSTAAKFTQHFTSFKCKRLWESTYKSATYTDTIREL